CCQTGCQGNARKREGACAPARHWLLAEDMELEYREWITDFGDSGDVALHHYDGETAVILAVRHQKEAGY
ncbi:MAG TPA: hypothetical protein VF243_03325, partial [Nitrosospira sp.]